MMEKQNKKVLAICPPDLISRKSRDSEAGIFFNAVRSDDADRLEEFYSSVDLSACKAPDSVKGKVVGKSFNAVRSGDADRLEENISINRNSSSRTMKDEELKSGQFYHIYNCGINGENLFRESENYEHFLGLMDKYILPVADVFAWVLMPNHFHLLVRIKGNVVYKYSFADRDREGLPWFAEHKWETTDLSACSRQIGTESVKLPKPNLHFSHFCNAYSKYYNERYTRHGGLFERRFERKHIDNEWYLKRVILYIHNNPVHHGFCSHPLEYPWSSYLTCISVKTTRLKRESVMGWFDSDANFKIRHNEKIDIERIEKWLGL